MKTQITQMRITSSKSVMRVCRKSAASLAASTLILITSIATGQESMVDRVLVIINEDVITQSEFDYRYDTIVSEMQAANQPIPPELTKQLLDTMVSDRLQVQEAERRGITISDEQLQQALGRFAAQQNLSVEQLTFSVEQSGQPFDLFAATVRDSMTISRFSEYYARTRVVVPDYEIDGFLVAQGLDQDDIEYEVAQILIKGGDDKREVAGQVRDEIARGTSFQEAVLTYSEALDAQNGGVIGWRKPDQLPSVFVDALKDLQVGDVSEVVQSPNGFHILKLMNLKGDRQEIVQSNVRHILISAESRVARAQAKKRALELRDRIVSGGEDFDALARIYSDDSASAALGGSLGWVSPGQMVANFEEAYKALGIGQISEPIETQFGVHVLQVEDRRTKNVTEQIKRARADSILRRQRADREFGQWVRELMEGAYIKHVAKPA